MFEKGPGSGYMVAKAVALRLAPQARCRRFTPGRPFVVLIDGAVIASARSARAAWNDALGVLAWRRVAALVRGVARL